jgi:hypothetical protein
MFCVYAAETLRRRHVGGPWTWETVFAELGHATPDYQSIYAWVEKRLRHFKRPLLKSRLGHREFLVTLACEGGIPLWLLQKESAHLSRYFRELLTVYHREYRLPGCDATDIARQVAARFLPVSLRHDTVFKLSGDLIQSVVQLQKQVDDTTDHITSLDRMQPHWRDDLPLPVEDATIEALLRNLMGQARNLALTERQRWRWTCALVCQGENWSIEQRLELPSTVTGASLRDWSGWDDPPVRLRVLLHTPDGIEATALLTRLQGMGEQATYRCEELRWGGIRLLRNAATTGVRSIGIVKHIFSCVHRYRQTGSSINSCSLAKHGHVNVLSGASYGYIYIPVGEAGQARYDIHPEEAEVVRRIFILYVEEGFSIGTITCHLTAAHIPTRRGAPQWERSVVWGILRNPAYTGQAAYRKTQAVPRTRPPNKPMT